MYHNSICGCPDCIRKAYKNLIDFERKKRGEERRQMLLDKRITVTCKICGSKRKLPISRTKIFKYCSKPCHNTGMKKERKGKMWYEYSGSKGGDIN